jgi:hypothetical protein
MRPVPQRLRIHRVNLGGDLTAHPGKHRRQRPQPPRLFGKSRTRVIFNGGWDKTEKLMTSYRFYS